METAFGTSFADVRIHANSAAAPALGARAFTLGTDVHFAPGEYRPNAKAGMHVLGHELAHVVQQHGTNHASATRLTRRSGAGRGIVRRLVAPAYVDETAGMHKYDVVAGNSHLVKKGGMTRSGILGDIPAGTRVMFDLDRQSPNYLLVTYNGQSGYVNRTHLTVAERIAGSDFYALEDKANKWVHFYDVSTGTYFDDAMPTGFKDEVIANLTVMLNALAAAEKATKLSVDKRRNVVKHVLHQYALGSPVDPGLWPLAAANLAVVKQRVANDLADLERAGLITMTCVLESVEFTGADFHKHGQAPLFLTFYDVLSKQPVRIVYKPGDLSVDRAVFGKSGAGGAKGVAETMDPTGNYASVYTILPREDAVHQKYGFMQFVETGLPQTAQDLEGVYRSLAVNMAVSYLVGLEDVHHENVLLLTNRVQVIDMEATTGAFNMDPNDLTTGGFGAMLWWKAINDGIKPKLKKAVDAGTADGRTDDRHSAGSDDDGVPQGSRTRCESRQGRRCASGRPRPTTRPTRPDQDRGLLPSDRPGEECRQPACVAHEGRHRRRDGQRRTGRDRAHRCLRQASTAIAGNLRVAPSRRGALLQP